MNLEGVSRLSPRVIRILGFNPGLMTLDGTNTYLVGGNERKILIDTGEINKKKYVDTLDAVLRQLNATLSHIILTHWHYDHTGGLRDVFSRLDSGTEVLKFPRNTKDNSSMYDGIPITYLKDGEELKLDDSTTLRVIHTPGHTTDHISLLLEQEKAIFSGDCVLGMGTCVFEDLFDYINSLKKLITFNGEVMYPGHGPVVSDPRSKIECYIKHRQHRENQIVEVLKKYENYCGTSDIVEAIYDKLNPELSKAAENNVKVHLNKLKKEGKVHEKVGMYRLETSQN